MPLPPLPTKSSALSPSKYRRPQSHPSPAPGRYSANPSSPAKPSMLSPPKHRLALPQSGLAPDRYTTNPPPLTKPSALSPSKYRHPHSHPSPALGRYTVRPMLPTKSSAHKRPVDRPVGLRVCRCRYRRRPLADVPKERAAIQLPESKRPFPERRAAWGWLPAAAFHPANPQPEASAGFLVPFSKKGTSF